MTLQEMRETVKEEMRHIPKGDDPQNKMRMLYWSMRMNSLGKKAEGRRIDCPSFKASSTT